MKITDEKLYRICKQYGEQALRWRRKFAGLLPEVNRRRLYEKHDMSSIFEFAAKLCGMSEKQVRLALNLCENFKDKPVLKSLLENGEVSMNKLARVASIATPENEEQLAAMVKVLPRNALETFVRDEKFARETAGANATMDSAGENQNGSQKPLFDDKSLHVQRLNFEFSDEVIKELNQLHAQGRDMNALILQLLANRQEKISQEKEKLSAAAQPTKSRYIKIAVTKIIKEEYGEKCSIDGCENPAINIHHTQTFTISQKHDPKYLAPLCKNHHVIAHSVNMKYHQARADAV